MEKNEIETYEEFISIIESNLPVEIEDDEVNIQNITSFEIRIDYENRIVIVTTEENASYAKAYGASNSVSRSYYTDAGIKIFTIKIDGTFSYSTGSCSTVTASGSYNRSFLSLWTSTPIISSGNITAKKAYARISGVATSGSSNISYSLTLTCDDSGNFSSY